ncbi:AAA family ATPase [Acidobacteriota bacterium]
MGRNTFEQIYNELKHIVENEKHKNLLEALKEKACNAEINKRDQFENALLSLAQKISHTEIRPVLYEILVALQAIWNKDQPKIGLQDKFWEAIRREDYENALLIYKALTKQGLDYIGSFQKEEGELIPLVTAKEYMLLQYNKRELTFYNLQLEQITNIPMPEYLEIIDVIAPLTIKSRESMKSTTIKDQDKEIWILFKNEIGKKSILPVNMEDINSLRAAHKSIELWGFHFNKETSFPNHLSYYQSHLLMVAPNAVYYKKGADWKKWYSTGNENKITAYESTGKGFWVGHANGDVFILKNLKRVGLRDKLDVHSDTIRSIRRSEEFVIIFSKNILSVTDHAGNLILGPIKTDCEIIQAAILNNESVLIHMANGMLIAKELKQGNDCWQINLGDIYETFFTFRQYLYCSKRSEETKRFEKPIFTPMVKALESKNIYVDSTRVESRSDASVKYISEFIGRRELLNDIKDTGNTHFLLYGEPKIGKTSLLNVLRDTLSESAKCCYIDFAQLLKDAKSYAEFEKYFMDKCLRQHLMNISELNLKQGYQAFRSMVNNIRGARKFCVFCLDNFYISRRYDEDYYKNATIFLRSMLIHPNVRVIMTCNSKGKKKIMEFFDDFRDILRQRKLLDRPISLFSETEVKEALRRKVSLKGEIVDKVYKYIGRFPHLVHLYDKFNINRKSIEEQSKVIAKESSERIFKYFRDLSPDAYLLIATCLRYNLLSEKNSFTTFYQSYPFLESSLPKPELQKALQEIAGYGDGFSTNSDSESFHISPKDDAQLFKEASEYIPWLNDFSTLYQFTSASDLGRAHSVAQTFTRITRSALDSNEFLNKFVAKYKKIFYVNQLTDEGREVLDIPLTTFIVIPLKPWKTDPNRKAFNDLYVSIQEFKRLSGESSHESGIQKFYILLFELHGTPNEKVKEDLIGLERISIINASMMKDIILDRSPQQKASEYIFDQLSIKERSPYTTSGAVPDELFFGREMEMQLIRGLPENIGIFGTRTIGKTSLLRKLNKDIKGQKKWKVYAMDCSRIENEESLLKNLAEKMAIPFESISDMEKFRRYVTEKVENSGQQYLFLLDEVDRLVQYDIEHDQKIFNTFNRLCTEAMEKVESAARFILFGFQQMFEQMKNPDSRLYNFMVFLPLKPLDVESALALVTQPIEKIRVRWKNKKDALYLVDSCSGHPRLLQAACHSLLTILESREGKKDEIEKDDVDKALTSPDFRELCMRFYRNPTEEKEVRKKTRFHLFSKRQQTGDKKLIQHETSPKGTELWNDLHRITILSAISMLFEQDNESFSITDIQRELKKHKLDISPNAMRIILDHLCLSSIFHLKDESTLVARKDTDVPKNVEQNIVAKEKDFTIGKPDVYSSDDTTFPKFIYEFGVKIFPKLLVGHFGGINQCNEELKKLMEKKGWVEWLRRY